MFCLSSTTAAPYGSRGLFLIREMANFCYWFFFCSLKKKKTGKTTTTNKSAHAKAPKLSRCADVIQLCHRTSTMCQSPNSGQQFLPTELVFTLSRSLSAVRSQNDPGLEITSSYQLFLSLKWRRLELWVLTQFSCPKCHGRFVEVSNDHLLLRKLLQNSISLASDRYGTL